MRLTVFILVFLTSCGSSEQKKITIACASNLAPAIDSIATVYHEKEEIEIEVISGASGTLCTQIEQGAPYDIFITASYAYLNRLEEQGLASQADVLVESKLYAICTKYQFLRSLDTVLLSDQTVTIGIPDPEVAPYGEAAKEYLQNKNIWEKVEDKIVYAEDVAQLNTYLQSETIDVGFSVAHYAREPRKSFVVYEVDTTFYTPISQSVALIKSEEMKAPRKFVDFLYSDQASEILEYFGY